MRGISELEEILKSQADENQKNFDELRELIKSLMGTGIKVPGTDQSSSLPQQPTSPSDSEKLEEKWKKFFDKNGIDQSQQTTWKVDSGLTPDEAQRVWNNDWKDLTEAGGIGNLGSEKVSYTSEEENETITTNDVDLLKHKKIALDTIHKCIFDIKNTDKFPLLDDKKIKETIGKMAIPW